MRLTLTVLICGLLASAFAAEVKNGKVPSGTKKSLLLKEELRIDGDGEEAFNWSGTKVTVVANEKGTIYVMDPASYQLLRFDDKGTLLNTVGAEGEGPGEFRFMTNLSLLEDGTLCVFEFLSGTHVFTRFDAELKFIDQKKYPPFEGKIIQSANFSSAAGMYSGYWLKIDSAQKMSVNSGIFSMDNKLLLNTDSRELFPFDQNSYTDPNWWVGFMAQWFALGPVQPIVAFDNQGDVYVANTDTYKVTRYNSDLKEELTFSRDYKPIPLKEEDLIKMIDSIKEQVLASLPGGLHKYITTVAVSKAMEKADFAPIKQPIYGIVPMGDHILVLHDYHIDKGILTADIFDKEGRFLGTSDLPRISYNYYGAYFGDFLKLRFVKDKAYALVKDEYDELSVVRYTHRLVDAK